MLRKEASGLRLFSGLTGRLMAEETRQSRNIKVKPSILRKAYQRAIESEKRLCEWLEEAIEEKIEREQKKVKEKRPVGAGLSDLDS